MYFEYIIAESNEQWQMERSGGQYSFSSKNELKGSEREGERGRKRKKKDGKPQLSIIEDRSGSFEYRSSCHLNESDLLLYLHQRLNRISKSKIKALRKLTWIDGIGFNRNGITAESNQTMQKDHVFVHS